MNCTYTTSERHNTADYGSSKATLATVEQLCSNFITTTNFSD